MKKKKNTDKKQVFVDNVNMETQTVFMTDGNINIYPCDFEYGQHIVSGGDRVAQKGRMVTNDDGTSHFRAYRQNSGSRYTTLWVERYGRLKMSRTRLVMTISVPLGMVGAMDELSLEAEHMKPENTDRNVIREIEEAIVNLKKKK